MTWRAVRWVPFLVLGSLWWWGVLRLVFSPDAGVLEGAVAAGGWGLSVLPVHCVPRARALGEARAARGADPAQYARRPDGELRWPGERTALAWWGRAAVSAGRVRGRALRVRATRAWRRRRSGGGSGPS
ncbi:hypothetical protein DEJ48_10160 [Streptomyces venezuelae]|uniref:Uncharacterized protein n=1 Tax=Streptomyces venezuelae TaxID=54571 RepID=A0A5P2C8B6_STRVZ|nr:hypothetical protein [Streptomyces venezuelae]QES38934.1 hypothetical protein DEJ48_10160 [Streptomyces venezuelae]